MSKMAGLLAVLAGMLLYGAQQGAAQEYKLRQVMEMQHSKIETTLFVKGKRQRVESVVPGMGMTLAVVEQCDLKRTIKLNDKRKLYYIEPFAAPGTEALQPRKEVVAAKQEKEVKKGGTITIWSSIRDTGERKKMFGFTARHLWTTQKMKPSADACSLKDSLLRRTDGWYIDLDLYECRRGHSPVPYGDGRADPGCVDKMVTHTSGKGKPGFPLFEKTTMVTGSTTMETNLETLELSTAKLDTLLFTIPPGYRQVSKESDLFDLEDMAGILQNAGVDKEEAVVNKEQKTPGKIRIGVFVPTGSEQIEPGALQQHLVKQINRRDVEAIAVGSEEEARRYQCDYTLNTAFSSLKQEGVVGGVIKAIRRRDPAVATSYNVQGVLTLQSVKDGTEKSRQAVEGKYEGRAEEAASRAVDEAWQRVLKVLR
ncbi:MAG TPA: hypothetical protein VGE66_00575 [Chitinophagaceae bacterium]